MYSFPILLVLTIKYAVQAVPLPHSNHSTPVHSVQRRTTTLLPRDPESPLGVIIQRDLIRICIHIGGIATPILNGGKCDGEERLVPPNDPILNGGAPVDTPADGNGGGGLGVAIHIGDQGNGGAPQGNAPDTPANPGDDGLGNLFGGLGNTLLGHPKTASKANPSPGSNTGSNSNSRNGHNGHNGHNKQDDDPSSPPSHPSDFTGGGDPDSENSPTDNDQYPEDHESHDGLNNSGHDDDPGQDVAHDRSDETSHGSDGGDHGSDGGDHGSDGGDHGSDGGDHGSDGGDHGSDGGDHGSDRDDHGPDGYEGFIPGKNEAESSKISESRGQSGKTPQHASSGGDHELDGYEGVIPGQNGYPAADKHGNGRPSDRVGSKAGRGRDGTREDGYAWGHKDGGKRHKHLTVDHGHDHGHGKSFRGPGHNRPISGNNVEECDEDSEHAHSHDDFARPHSKPWSSKSKPSAKPGALYLHKDRPHPLKSHSSHSHSSSHHSQWTDNESECGCDW